MAIKLSKNKALRKRLVDNARRIKINAKKRIPIIKKRISLLQRQLAQERQNLRGLI